MVCRPAWLLCRALFLCWSFYDGINHALDISDCVWAWQKVNQGIISLCTPSEVVGAHQLI